MFAKVGQQLLVGQGRPAGVCPGDHRNVVVVSGNAVSIDRQASFVAESAMGAVEDKKLLETSPRRIDDAKIFNPEGPVVGWQVINDVRRGTCKTPVDQEPDPPEGPGLAGFRQYFLDFRCFLREVSSVAWSKGVSR